jgi:DNA-binding response OmpR family regulator
MSLFTRPTKNAGRYWLPEGQVGYIRNHFALSTTKVVIVSGEERMAKSVTSLWKVDEYLAKPVSPLELQNVVISLLEDTLEPAHVF